MSRTPHRRFELIAAMSCLVVTTDAVAALKDQPPDGLTLAGTEWKIDRYNSDDPTTVIDRAEREAQARADRERDRANRSVFDPDDDPGRGGFPDRTSRRGDRGPLDRSTDIDPWGGVISSSIQLGSRGRNGFLEQLIRNPDELSFVQNGQRVTVSADRLETDCIAGTRGPISDSYGDGQQSCGWNGRAWVVETKRSDFTRTDRYELSKDGKTLKYVTTASGRGIPDVRITRSYKVTTAAE